MRKLTKKEQQERRFRLNSDRAIRAKTSSEFWIGFTKHFRPWLYELTRKYKERGEFPLMGCWLLPSYYMKREDIEVAVIASLLISDTCRVMERVTAFREMMRDEPFEWFKNRGFVSLGFGKERVKKTGEVDNSRIAEYLDLFHSQWAERERRFPYIFDRIFCDVYSSSKERLLRMVMGTSDGIGRGLWNVGDHELRCPLTKEVMYLLKTFYPDYYRNHDYDAAVHQFGFKRDCDFFYAALAYQELCKRNPKGCLRLATLFNKRYDECNIRYANSLTEWGRILPEISF